MPTTAAAWSARGDLAGAVEDYDRAILLDPSYWLALANRGIVLARLGRTAEASSSFDRALAAAPAQQHPAIARERRKSLGK